MLHDEREAGGLCRYLPDDNDAGSEHDPMEQPTYNDNTGALEPVTAPSGCTVCSAAPRTHQLKWPVRW